MLFGKYNVFIDELGHLFFAVLIISPFYSFGTITIYEALIIFFSALLIDLDHIFNAFIANRLGLNSYKSTFSYGDNGITIKILHGIDVFFLIASITWILSSDMFLSITVFLTLCIHELWDYIVYPHSWHELFLLTRARKNFKPGERSRYIGLIFDKETLNY